MFSSAPNCSPVIVKARAATLFAVTAACTIGSRTTFFGATVASADITSSSALLASTGLIVSLPSAVATRFFSSIFVALTTAALPSSVASVMAGVAASTFSGLPSSLLTGLFSLSTVPASTGAGVGVTGSGDAGSVTVTVQAAEVFDPLAVMTAMPALTAVTVPSLTVATAVSLLFQVMLSFASYLAVALPVAPMLSSILDGVTLTGAAARTVTTHVPTDLPIAPVAVTSAVPAPTAVMLPDLSTVTTSSFLDAHVKSSSMSLDAVNFAVGVRPSTSSAAVGVTATPARATTYLPSTCLTT
ncbi:hypothetical protein SDC9_98071 [bioreactor metagenome]|uniref:Uncharacterized protein n=1 Tax=bioreactor metagenome TaxID=1076179 RepID=A0A645AKD4_9ZZZZ